MISHIKHGRNYVVGTLQLPKSADCGAAVHLHLCVCAATSSVADRPKGGRLRRDFPESGGYWGQTQSYCGFCLLFDGLRYSLLQISRSF
jgi:hypothetical protein